MITTTFPNDAGLTGKGSLDQAHLLPGLKMRVDHDLAHGLIQQAFQLAQCVCHLIGIRHRKNSHRQAAGEEVITMTVGGKKVATQQRTLMPAPTFAGSMGIAMLNEVAVGYSLVHQVSTIPTQPRSGHLGHPPPSYPGIQKVIRKGCARANLMIGRTTCCARLIVAG